MKNTYLELLGYAFFLWGFLIVIYTFLSLRRMKPRVQIIMFINGFYSIIYGFTPGAICVYVSKNVITHPLDYIKFTTEGIGQIGLFLMLSIVTFIGINFGYRIKINCKVAKNGYITQNKVRIAAFFLMFIGWLSLLLWTNVYGGPIGILPYANALRAGRDVGIYNPWSFMMKLCPFMQFAAYMFFSQYLSNRKKIDLLFFILSGVGSFLYILANSSRMHFGLFFLILILLYTGHKKVTMKTYCILGIVGIVALGIMYIGEDLMGALQNNTVVQSTFTFNVVKIIREEFFFPMASFQTCLDGINAGEVGIRLFEDMANAVFAWLPSRFKPSKLVSLEMTNTLLHSGTTLYGGLPTDFVTTCIYELNIIGIFILPVLFGFIAKVFEKKYRPLFKEDYYKVLYILGSFYFVKAVGYGDPANIMSNIFFLVWGHIFTVVICKIIKGKKQ